MGCGQTILREAAGAPGAPPLPNVPARSWYGAAFAETTSAPLSEFHMKQRGRVVFSNASIPSSAAELEELPGRSPEVFETAEIGRGFIYGMGYFYNTPLYIEHCWRKRIVFLNELCNGGTADEHQSTQKDFSLNVDMGSNGPDDYERRSLDELSKTVYDRPSSDTFIGIKVFVNEELVHNRYPNKRSLPGCTATIESAEAFSNWVCVPIVLVGFLNNFLLRSIYLYRYLSLNFVEHMLSQGLTSSNKNNDMVQNSNDSLTFHVRVEVVYGCRSLMNFCTEYISRGSLQVVMTERSWDALKSYEEKLRKLIRNNPSHDQVLPMDRLALMTLENSPFQRCLFCDTPLRFTCSVCGAQLCGMPSCARRPFTGYPHGCPSHKAQTL